MRKADEESLSEKLKQILWTLKAQRTLRFKRKSVRRNLNRKNSSFDTTSNFVSPVQTQVHDFRNSTLKPASVVYHPPGIKLKTIRRKIQKNAKFEIKRQRKLRKSKSSFEWAPETSYVVPKIVSNIVMPIFHLLISGIWNLFMFLIGWRLIRYYSLVESFWIYLKVKYIIYRVR